MNIFEPFIETVERLRFMMNALKSMTVKKVYFTYDECK